MHQRFAVVSLSGLLLLGGCRAPVALHPDELARVLEPGDRLRVTDATGAETRLIFERVDRGALIGRAGAASVRVPREDWARVARMELAWGRTFLLVAAGTVLALGLAASTVAGSIMP